MKKNLSKSKRVDLRDVWDSEPEFTQWLAKEDNLKELSEEIGVNIKAVQTEANAGKYKVDILAEEESSGRKIVIENQFEDANHDHLGKIITYAAWYDAKIIIWIVPDAGKEHRRAVEWLNKNFGEEINYFLIKIVVKESEIEHTSNFSILVSPEEWQKSSKSRLPSGSPTKTELKYLDFWEKFKNFVKAKDAYIRLQTPRRQSYYEITMGSSEAYIELTLNSQKNLLGCRIYIRKNKELFNFFKKRNEEIEKEIGEQVNWVDKVASCIEIKKAVPDLFSQDEAESHFFWLYEKTILLKKIFRKHFDEFKKTM